MTHLDPAEQQLCVFVAKHRRVSGLHDRNGVEQEMQPQALWCYLAPH